VIADLSPSQLATYRSTQTAPADFDDFWDATLARARSAATATRVDPVDAGLVTLAVALDTDGTVVGGGSHGPRGETTELTGIAVLPRARRQMSFAAITAALVADARDRGIRTVFLSAQDEAVARVYERVGFERVGTACIAEPR